MIDEMAEEIEKVIDENNSKFEGSQRNRIERKRKRKS
jgi:hypothetical protein